MSDESVGGNSGAAAAATGAASPAAQTTSASGDASSAAQSTPATGTTDSTEREGYIPRARFDEVNLRMTEAEKQLSGWKDWQAIREAGIHPAQLQDLWSFYGRYRNDSGEFVESLIQEALADQTQGPLMRSRMGKLLNSLRQQQAEPSFEPDVPVMNEHGQIVKQTYSSDLVKQIIAHEIGKALQPFQQDLTTRQQRDVQQQQDQAITTEITRIREGVQKLPKAKEHWEAIVKRSRELVAADRHMHPGEAVRDAYMELVLPTLGAAAEAKVLSDLQQKASAQTVGTGTPVGRAAPRFKSFKEAAAYYDAHPEERAAMANQ